MTKEEILKDGERLAYIMGVASCRCIDSIKDKYFSNTIFGQIKRIFSKVMISGIAGYKQKVTSNGKIIGTFKVGEDAFITYINNK